MKLYVTPGSAYARMARVVVIEKGLEGRVEVVAARTRQADSPYYGISASGRVPYLVRDDGTGLEESALVCRYLDQLDGQPRLDVAAAGADPWEALRLEAAARSLLDGLAVWTREILRPPGEQSPGVIAHEAARAARLVAWWEGESAHPLLGAPLNMLQITLACALGLEARIPALRWRAGRPRLERWYDAVAARPSFVATQPPAYQPPASPPAAPDADLDRLPREQLAAEVRALRAGIRKDRDSSGQELCWHHPGLWALLPEQTDPLPVVPAWPQFLQGCVRYRQSLDEQAPDAPRSDEPYEPGPRS